MRTAISCQTASTSAFELTLSILLNFRHEVYYSSSSIFSQSTYKRALRENEETRALDECACAVRRARRRVTRAQSLRLE